MSNQVTPRIDELERKLGVAVVALKRIVGEEHAEGEGTCSRHTGCESPQIAEMALMEITDDS